MEKKATGEAIVGKHTYDLFSSSLFSRLRVLFHAILALTIWIGPLYLTVGLALTAFFLPPNQAFAVLGFLLFFAVVPLDEDSKFGAKLSRYICKYSCAYFPMDLHVEDINAFDPDHAYVFGFEPHSVFPFGVLAILDHMSLMLRQRIKFLASSVIFCTPFVRQIWAWIGLTPVTKQNFVSLLAAGCSCIIVPGGIREAFYMEPTSEAAFLKTRKGFIRVAMGSGRALVPVFCFGQTSVYKWWKPKGSWYHSFCRAIKFTPYFFWGMFGTPLPYRNPIHVVVGRPIELKKNPNPTIEEVNDIHGQFVEALQDLFERHKARVGHTDLQLRIH